MNLFKIFNNKIQKKGRSLLDDYIRGDKEDLPIISKANFCKHYENNPIVFKCINTIANNLSDLVLETTDLKGETLARNIFFEQIFNNNYKRFFQDWSVYHLINGESFLEKTKTRSGKFDLKLVNPLDVTISENTNTEYPSAYYVNKNGMQITYNVNQLTGETEPIITEVGITQLFHLKDLNTENSKIGLSPVQACLYAIESFSFALAWNRSLLNNKAVPSYILQTAGQLDSEQLSNISTMMERFEGYKKAAKGIVLDGGLEYNQMGLSPADMDFKSMLDKMSEYIASCFKVPLVLIVPVQATYNNISEAKYSLYRDAVLPLANNFLSFLQEIFKNDFSGIKLNYNQEAIPSLVLERQSQIDNLTKLVNAGIISRDEARAELGWEQRGSEANDLLINQSLVPIELVGESEANRQDLANSMRETGFQEEEINNVLQQ